MSKSLSSWNYDEGKTTRQMCTGYNNWITEEQFKSVFKTESVLFTFFYLVIAIAAINWPAFAWFKRHLSVFTTLGTCCRVHFPWPSSISLRFSWLSAGLTALRVISKTLGRIEFLLSSSEGEGCATVGALEWLILETQWMTSWYLFVWLALRSSSTWEVCE